MVEPNKGLPQRSRFASRSIRYRTSNIIFSDELRVIQPRYLKEKLIAALPKLKKLIYEIASYREDYLPSSSESLDPFTIEDAKKDRSKNRVGKKIFIVHGHDEANLYKLRDLLKDRYKLGCIIMKFQAGKGRTLIEKFEEEAGDAGFAFILMTPDDLVEIPGKKEQYAQARPNVIFELGWFHGRLGRNRVCILFKKGTQIHSDLAGVSRIEFNESVEEKVLEIEQELRAAELIK